MLATAWINYKNTASYFQLSLSSNGISSFAACRANCGGSLLAELVVQVGEDYTRALAREQIRRRPAKALELPLDARGGSGYEGDFAFHSHSGVSEVATRR